MNKILRYWNDESGASAAEYALILALVGGGIALAASNLGTAVTGAMQNATNAINNPASAGGGGGGGGGTTTP